MYFLVRKVTSYWGDDELALHVVMTEDDGDHHAEIGLHRFIDSKKIGVLKIAVWGEEVFDITVVDRIDMVGIFRMMASKRAVDVDKHFLAQKALQALQIVLLIHGSLLGLGDIPFADVLVMGLTGDAVFLDDLLEMFDKFFHFFLFI